MSKLSRTKGHNHEREVADAYRKRWPDRTVRRALQADQAFEPDVVIEGHDIWTECEVGKAPSPLKKLAQAERDAERHRARRVARGDVGCIMYPIVVWRRHGARNTQLTCRLGTLLRLCAGPHAPPYPGALDLVVTVDFEPALKLFQV